MQGDVSLPKTYIRPASTNEGNWIRRLVDSEAELLRTGSADLVGHQDHRRVVEEATVEFLSSLKTEFTRCVDLFNAYRGGSHLPNSIKMFNVSNTAADFILFRNSLKLVIANPALGVINFSFVSRSVPMAKPSAGKNKREGYDLIAQLFPFNDLAWTFHGERVAADAIVRYMFTEFVKSSSVF